MALPIVVGELVGYRAWWLRGGLLQSLAHSYVWQPGGVVEGNVDQLLWGDGTWVRATYAGVYAFKEQHDSLIEGRAWFNVRDSMLPSYDSLVFGTIWLWGEVVEHERGYRAQFAKVRSLDSALGPCDMVALRVAYGVG